MAESGPRGPHGVDATPDAFAQVAPRDLHPVADIRLVITDVAKLSERIDNLIGRVSDLKADGKEAREKSDKMKESIDSFRGAMKVMGGIYAFALVLVAAFLAWFLKPVPAPVVAMPTAPLTAAPQGPAVTKVP